MAGTRTDIGLQCEPGHRKRERKQSACSTTRQKIVITCLGKCYDKKKKMTKKMMLADTLCLSVYSQMECNC